MSDSDVKYFWQHAANLTYLEMQEVARNLQEAADSDFDFTNIHDLMGLLANTSSWDVEARRIEAERERQEKAAA